MSANGDAVATTLTLTLTAKEADVGICAVVITLANTLTMDLSDVVLSAQVVKDLKDPVDGVSVHEVLAAKVQALTPTNTLMAKV